MQGETEICQRDVAINVGILRGRAGDRTKRDRSSSRQENFNLPFIYLKGEERERIRDGYCYSNKNKKNEAK